MTALDRQLERLAAGIDALPRRSQAAVFGVVSELYSEAMIWPSGMRDDMRDLLSRAQEVARAFCLGAPSSAGAALLLSQVEAWLPEGVLAQGSWTCADAALRIAAQGDFQSGMSIEYALEPVLGRTSERLFGVWQLGSGEDEDEQIGVIMAEPAVEASLAFMDWAIQTLATTVPPTSELLAVMRRRGAVLVEEQSDD